MEELNKITVLKINPKEKTLVFDEIEKDYISKIKEFIDEELEVVQVDDNYKFGSLVLFCSKTVNMKELRPFKCVRIDKEFLIYGKSVICKLNREGEFESLRPVDVKILENSIKFLDGIIWAKIIDVDLIDLKKKSFEIVKKLYPTDEYIRSLVGFDPKFKDVLKYEDRTFVSILNDEDDELMI